MKVALIHDWLTGMRGGEWVLEEIASLFPDAPIHTLVHRRGSVSAAIESHPIRTSFIQRIPGGTRRYRSLLPLMPLAAESFDLGAFDLIVSSSHCVAKGVRPPPGAMHISYLHTPMRYIWHLYDDYARGASLAGRAAMSLAVRPLRRWDVASSRRVDAFIANSETVRRRIRAVYGREAEVIHPPIDTGFFTPGSPGEDGGSGPHAGGVSQGPDGYYLMVTALVPYKRVDLAMEAFAGAGRTLTIAGTGPEAGRLRRRSPAGVNFIGWQPRETLRELYRGARALIFPGLEDFGMAPVECMAAGTPVIAFGAGGVTESVVGPLVAADGPTGAWIGGPPSRVGPATGVFFDAQTPAALRRALREFETMSFDARVIRARALDFSRERFRARFIATIGRLAGVAMGPGFDPEAACTDTWGS